jgi:hypothetical protein
MKVPNLRELEVTTEEGKHVCDTRMLKGEASDSLHGTNVLKQFVTASGETGGPHGGEAVYGTKGTNHSGHQQTAKGD